MSAPVTHSPSRSINIYQTPSKTRENEKKTPLAKLEKLSFSPSAPEESLISHTLTKNQTPTKGTPTPTKAFHTPTKTNEVAYSTLHSEVKKESTVKSFSTDRDDEENYQFAQYIPPLEEGFLRIAYEIKNEGIRIDLWKKRKEASLKCALETLPSFNIQDKDFLKETLYEVSKKNRTLFFVHARKFEMHLYDLTLILKDFAAHHPKETLTNLSKFLFIDITDIEEILEMIAYRLHPKEFAEIFCQNSFGLQPDILRPALEKLVIRSSLYAFFELMTYVAKLHDRKLQFLHPNHSYFLQNIKVDTQDHFLVASLDLLIDHDPKFVMDQLGALEVFMGGRATEFGYDNSYPLRKCGNPEEIIKACVKRVVEGADKKDSVINARALSEMSLLTQNQSTTYNERSKIEAEKKEAKDEIIDIKWDRIYQFTLTLNPMSSGYKIVAINIPYESLRRDLWKKLRDANLSLAFDSLGDFNLNIQNDEDFLKEQAKLLVRQPLILFRHIQLFKRKDRDLLYKIAEALSTTYPGKLFIRLQHFIDDQEKNPEAIKENAEKIRKVLVNIVSRIEEKDFCVHICDTYFPKTFHPSFLADALNILVKKLGTQKFYEMVRHVATLHDGKVLETKKNRENHSPNIKKETQDLFIQISVKLLAENDPKLVMDKIKEIILFLGGINPHGKSPTFPMREPCTFDSKPCEEIVDICIKASEEHKKALLITAQNQEKCSIQ